MSDARQRMLAQDIRRLAEAELEQDQQAGFNPPTQDPLPPMVSVFSSAPKALGAKGAEYLISMTFRSSKAGTPHIVTMLSDGRVHCTCDAMLSVDSRPALCWAAQEFRVVKGLPRV